MLKMQRDYLERTTQEANAARDLHVAMMDQQAAQHAQSLREASQLAARATATREAGFNLTQLATHLPAQQRKALLSQTIPLAAKELPEPADLGPFWL
jgi:hypothetical protein